MLMRLDLALIAEIAEAVGRMVAGEVVVVALAEEDREDIELPLHSFLVETDKIYS